MVRNCERLYKNFSSSYKQFKSSYASLLEIVNNFESFTKSLASKTPQDFGTDNLFLSNCERWIHMFIGVRDEYCLVYYGVPTRRYKKRTLDLKKFEANRLADSMLTVEKQNNNELVSCSFRGLKAMIEDLQVLLTALICLCEHN